VKNYVDVTDDMLKHPGGWRMADVPPQLPGLELFAAQADHARRM
jgi:hypothetical protein